MEGVIGEIRGFGGNFAPRNWAFCNGQLLAINSNQALFSILGTTYGGDGRTTFALPDLRGRAPISEGTGPGLSPRPLGQRSGTQTVTLTQNQMPSHSHSSSTAGLSVVVAASTAAATDQTPVTGYALGAPATDLGDVVQAYVNDTPTIGLTGGGVGGSLSIFNTGGSQYHNNMQPYLVIHWVICLTGIFPSRS